MRAQSLCTDRPGQRAQETTSCRPCGGGVS